MNVILLLLLPGAAPPVVPAFDEVVLVEGKGGDPTTLYLVLTAPKSSVREMNALVVRRTGAALEEVAVRKFKGAAPGGQRGGPEGSVVFLIREAKGDQGGAVTGFSVGQLREIIEADPKRAEALVSRHAWGFVGKLPVKRRPIGNRPRE